MQPPELARLQHGYRENALADPPPDATPTPVPPADLLGAILANGVDPERRLAIHRNHFATTLTEALAGVFEATRALVGPAYFDSAALRFARAHPPTSPCLFEYGDAFPAYIQAAPGMEDHGYVAHVARLEWAMHESFHAPAAPPLNPTRLAAVPPNDLAGVRLAAHPTLRLVSAPFPVARLWRSALDGAVDADALSGPADHLILTRREADVALEEIAPAMYSLIEAIIGGATLGEAAAIAAADAEFDFGDALGACLSIGVFADQQLT